MVPQYLSMIPLLPFAFDKDHLNMAVESSTLVPIREDLDSSFGLEPGYLDSFF
jgi:hypothetical protein